MLDQILVFFTGLFDPLGFPPRWYCGVWSQALGWLHIISDIIIGAAFSLIPILIFFFSANKDIYSLRWFLRLFASFTLLCGIGHFNEAYIFWNPIYRFQGLIKALTAIFSWTAVIYLAVLLPRLLSIPGRLKAQKLFPEIFDKLPVITILLDDNFYILQVNKAAECYLGMDKKDIVGKIFSTLFAPESQEALKFFLSSGDANKEMLAQVKLENSTSKHSVILHLQTLHSIDRDTYLMTFNALPELEETRINMLQRQQELEEVVTYKRSILENMQDGVITIDEAGYIKTMNPKACQILGFLQGQFNRILLSDIFACILDVTANEGQEILADLVKNRINYSSCPSKHLCIKLPDGHTRTVEFIVSEMKVGVNINYCIILHDITERLNYEDQLRANQVLIEQVTENIDSVIWIVNTDMSELLYCTKSYSRVFNASYQSLMEDPRAWLQAIHPDDLELVEKTFYSGHPFVEGHIIFRIIRPSGELRYLSAHTFNIDKPQRIGGITTDVTDFCIAKEELFQKCAELNARNDELDTFNHIMAHDLKAPVLAIKNLAKWIEEDALDVLSPESKHHILLLLNRVCRLENLLEDTFTYFFKTKREVLEETIEWKKMLEEILHSINKPETVIIKDNTHLKTLITKKVLLQQTLTNLISNAIKHHHDIKNTEIVISFKPEGSHCRFEITDNGPGISSQHLEEIFKPLTTLKSRDTVEGSGLGLAIVKKIVTQQGATISVSSQIGQGSTFSFTWPLTDFTLHANLSGKI